MRKYLNFLVVFYVLILLLFLSGCDLLDFSKDLDDTDIFVQSISPNPVAAAEDGYVIYDSYSDENNNYYLLYIGDIKDAYITTLNQVSYNGTPLDQEVTITETSSILESITECVNNSISFTDSNSFSIGAEAEYSKEFGFGSKISVKGNIGWSWSSSSTESKSVSTSNTYETAETYSKSQSVKYELNESKQSKLGYYRYAVYADVEVYFELITSKDNNELILWDTFVLPKEETEFTTRSEYSVESEFDNNPKSTIVLEEGYYKSLPLPNTLKPRYNSGDGTMNNPYLITSTDHFLNMLDDKVGYFELGEDIDLGDLGDSGKLSWEANKYNSPEAFEGTFDGKNKKISYELNIDKTTSDSWAFGLFPTTDGATIENLKVQVDLCTYDSQNRGEKWDIENDDRGVDVMVGGLVGYGYNTTINNVEVKGIINYNSDGGEGDTCVGGVVGFARTSVINNVQSYAIVYARGFYVHVGGVIAVTYQTEPSGLIFNGSTSYDNDWFWGETFEKDKVARENHDVLPNS